MGPHFVPSSEITRTTSSGGVVTFSETAKASGNTGFYASLHGAYVFTNKIFPEWIQWGLQTGLAFSFNNGYNHTFSNGGSGNTKFAVMDIPLLYNLNFLFRNNFSIRLSGGLNLAVALTDYEVSGESSSGISYTETQSIDTFSFGIISNLGVGYRIGSGNIIFDARFLANLSKKSSLQWQYHNGRPMLLVGYEYWF